MDAVIEKARGAFGSGEVKPALYRFEGGSCCLLGAAAAADGFDRQQGDADDYGESVGLTEREVCSLMIGWDANAPDAEADPECGDDPYAFAAGRSLRSEVYPDADDAF